MTTSRTDTHHQARVADSPLQEAHGFTASLDRPTDIDARHRGAA